MAPLCKKCNGSEMIIGYGYRSDSKGNILQYERPMSCECSVKRWDSTTITTTTTESEEK